MADWRKALGLSQSSLTLVWRIIFVVCIKSYHARTSCSFRKFCSASVAPSMCLCLSHGRALQHPRLKFAGRWDHFQRQWVCCPRHIPHVAHTIYNGSTRHKRHMVWTIHEFSVLCRVYNLHMPWGCRFCAIWCGQHICRVYYAVDNMSICRG